MVQRKVIVRGATNQALDELDAADIPDLSAAYEATGGIATHSADTTAVHGIADTSVIATDTEVATAVSDHEAAANPHPTYETAAEAAAQIGTHSADTTAIHGIADTSVLATATDLSTHASDSTAIHGITDTAALVVDGDAAGGQLSGTYPDPSVAASHSGSTHAATQAAAEATAASALTTHEGAADPHAGYLKENDASWTDLTDGGATVLHNHTTSRNVSAAGQAITANTVTYLTGSGILIPAAGFVVGQVYEWIIAVNKTNAGTATPVWTLRVGVNQTTADTTYLTITSTAQVATTSGTLIRVVAFVRTVSATVGIITAGINTGAASFGIGGSAVSGNLTNNADAGKRFGLCVNTGASAAWTVNSVMGGADLMAFGNRLAKLAQFLATGGTVPETAISTAETDTELRLRPDGAGGVEFVAGGDVVYSEPPASTAINSLTDVTIVSASVTVAAGDQLLVDAMFVIFNSSGASKAYTTSLDFDAQFPAEITAGNMGNARGHAIIVHGVLDVRSSSLAYGVWSWDGTSNVGTVDGGNATALTVLQHQKVWGSSAADLTGTVTVEFLIRSSDATATQTLHLNSFTVRRIRA